MANEDYVEDPWGAPPTMSNAWTSQATTRVPPVRATRKPHAKTRGGLKPGQPGFVYVAVARGAVKIGVTSRPDGRARDLRAKMAHVVPVVPAAAIEVETMALDRLGRCHLAPSEWVSATVGEAIAAVDGAMAAVGRYRRVDPAITEDEARRARIALAIVC